MDIATSVRNLSKKYRLYDNPKHRLKEALHQKYPHGFQVLNDTSCEGKNDIIDPDMNAVPGGFRQGESEAE